MNFKAVTATTKAVGKKDPNLLPCGYSLPSCLIPSAGQWQTSAIIAKDGVRKLGDRYIHDMVTLKDVLDVEEQARLEARAAYKQKIRFRNRSAEAKAVAKQHRLRTALLFVDCYHNTNKIMAVVEGNELVVNGLLTSFMKVAKNSEKDLIEDVNYKLDYRCCVFLASTGRHLIPTKTLIQMRIVIPTMMMKIQVLYTRDQSMMYSLMYMIVMPLTIVQALVQILMITTPQMKMMPKFWKLTLVRKTMGRRMVEESQVLVNWMLH
jgi:hypothetical protein